MDSIYDITSNTTLDTKADPVEYRKFFDQTSGSSTANDLTKAHWNFRVSDINSYWLLHRAYLMVEFDIAPLAGAPNERVTLANGIGNIIDRCVLRLGDTVVEDKPRHFYREHELDTMTWSKQYVDTVGSLMMYHPNSLQNADWTVANRGRSAYVKPGGGVATIGDYTLDPEAFDVPESPEGHNRLLTQGRSTYAMIPLYHLFNMPKVYQRVIRGLDIELEIYTTNDNIRVIRSATQDDGTASVAGSATNGTFHWKNAGLTLYLPRVVPPAQEQARLNRMLAEGVAPKIEFEKSIVHRESIASGNKSGEWSITTNTSTPTRIYLMLRSQASESDQNTPLYERQAFLSRLDLYVNGQHVPSENLEAPGATGASITQRNFTTYLRQWHNSQGNFDGVYDGSVGGSHLGLADFELKNIVAIDLKQMGRDLVDKSSDIRVEYTLDNAVNKGHYLYAIVFSKSTVQLEMSEGRSVAIVK